MVSEDKLAEFLTRIARLEPGAEWNCGFMLADWYTFATGKPDPISRYRDRGHHVDDDVAPLLSVVADELGLVETDAPARGDVGLIEIHGRRFGAICAGRRWVVLAERGISAAFAPVVHRAWRIG